MANIHAYCRPLSSFVCFLKNTSAPNRICGPIKLESRASFVKVSGELQVWRWASASLIGGKDYIDTRLKHRYCLLGILTIITLVLGGMWRMRRLRAREGKRQTEWGCCEGYVFILNTGLPHRDNQRLPGICTLKKQTENEKFRTQGFFFVAFF